MRNGDCGERDGGREMMEEGGRVGGCMKYGERDAWRE